MIWGSGWDPMLAQDDEGLLVRRMGEIVDGQYQKYSVSSGQYQREHFFGTHPKLEAMSKQAQAGAHPGTVAGDPDIDVERVVAPAVSAATSVSLAAASPSVSPSPNGAAQAVGTGASTT